MSSTSPKWLLLIALLVVVATSSRFRNDYVWDDVGLFVDSTFLFDLTNASELFRHDTMFAADGGKFAKRADLDTYRPVTLLTFMIDLALWNGSKTGLHFSGLLIHLICVVMMWFVGRAWLPRAHHAAVTFAVAVFAFHPLLAEAHVWINGRSDSPAPCLCSLAYCVGCVRSITERRFADFGCL